MFLGRGERQQGLLLLGIALQPQLGGVTPHCQHVAGLGLIRNQHLADGQNQWLLCTAHVPG